MWKAGCAETCTSGLEDGGSGNRAVVTPPRRRPPILLDLLDEQSIRDLLEILDDRQGIGSTVVASQLPVSHWHEYLGGGMVADSIMDRLLSNAHRIELESKESMRKESTGLTQNEQEPHADK